jgi:hypothetical protein
MVIFFIFMHNLIHQILRNTHKKESYDIFAVLGCVSNRSYVGSYVQLISAFSEG